MENFLSFERFINEQYENNSIQRNFDPSMASDFDEEIMQVSAISDFIPGKEYSLTVDGELYTDMIFQGVTDGIYIFNSEDQEEDFRFTRGEMEEIISAGASRMSM